MAGKGGIRSTTWKSGTNPTMTKGTKQKKTVLKETIGVDNWESLKSFLENEGAAKLKEEMEKLSKKDYVVAYNAMIEYFKPKLNRTTLVGDKDKPLTFTINYNNQPGNEPLNGE